jgi:hypothetical protein
VPQNPRECRRSATTTAAADSTNKTSIDMNPFRWLLNLSAAAAEKRGGQRDPWAFSYDSSVDAREYEEFIKVDGADLFVGNRKWPERWGELSPQRKRYARVVEADDGSQRLSIYERLDAKWHEVEGPSILESLDDAKVMARKMMATY